MRQIICAAGLAFLLAGCAVTPPPVTNVSSGVRLALSDDLQCRILGDLGLALAADNYDPTVLGEGEAKIDCTTAFQAAGLPMTGNPERSIRFNAPQFTDDDQATVKVDFLCLRLCGHGEEIHLHRDGSTWKIADRKPTWIS